MSGYSFSFEISFVSSRHLITLWLCWTYICISDISSGPKNLDRRHGAYIYIWMGYNQPVSRTWNANLHVQRVWGLTHWGWDWKDKMAKIIVLLHFWLWIRIWLFLICINLSISVKKLSTKNKFWVITRNSVRTFSVSARIRIVSSYFVA
jgi:hypothetical protein